MNKNFKLKFKVADVIIVIASAVISTSLMLGVFFYNKSFSGTRYLEVVCNDKVLDEYHLKIDDYKETYTITLKKETYSNLLDDFYIEINSNQGIRVTNITCPNHTCERMGWVNIPNLPIVCIPNHVSVSIVTNDTSSGDEVLGGVIYGKDTY